MFGWFRTRNPPCDVVAQLGRIEAKLDELLKVSADQQTIMALSRQVKAQSDSLQTALKNAYQKVT